MTATDLEQKMTYLRRLLSVYVKFLKYYQRADVTVEGNEITVLYHNAKNNGYKFQSIAFPLDDIDKRIEHYRQKVRTAFKNRSN